MSCKDLRIVSRIGRGKLLELVFRLVILLLGFCVVLMLMILFMLGGFGAGGVAVTSCD